MPRKTRVREHSRKNAPRVREHERALTVDPREHHAVSSRLDPKLEQNLFELVTSSDGAGIGEYNLISKHDGIDNLLMDGMSDGECLKQAEAILTEQYVEPAARERIMQRVREYLAREPTAEEMSSIQDDVDTVFSDVTEDQGRPYDRGTEYASQVPWEAFDRLGIPPREKYYDEAMKVIPDEDTWLVQRDVGGAVNDLSFRLDEMPLSRRQALRYAQSMLESPKGTSQRRRALDQLKRDDELRQLLNSIPADRPDHKYTEE
jgi:hypothetical protein